MLVENNIPPPEIFLEILQSIKKTGEPVKLLRGTCISCKRNKSLFVSDQTINGQGLGNFFKHLGSAAKNVGKKILNNPGRALELAANIGTAAASKSQKFIAATAPDIVKFFHQGKSLCLGKIH